MVARETTSIILVDHFLYVITNRQMSNLKENEHYKEFIHICLETFRLLRENASAIFGLLYLCIYQQMPLLNSIQNLNYIRQALFLTDKPCEMHMALNTYRKKIELARNDTRRFLDWIAHSLVHKPVHN
ncbi:unnamed protein product [Didymodactylos carnosus]|nr:unnamed protein product [Didymodactylos carnosus]CAF4443705.1 unnamed protein product [Didymodactylos carnosus]